MPVITIKKGDDPFKKYWWAILFGFVATGAWICLPFMDAGTGGGVAVREHGLESQSLDSVENGTGAPGSAVNLGMEGAGGAYKKKIYEGGIASSLYQPPPEEPSAAPKPAAAAPGTLADALKMISARKSASTDPSGWGGEKAQKGFAAPKANFGSMSGLSGGGSSSGASASASSGGGGSGPAVSAFNNEGPKTGVAYAKGLGASAGPGAAKNVAGALQNASSAMVAAANQGSADRAVGMAAGVFDGGGGRGGIGGEGGGAAGGGAGIYGGLDSAPVNLKVNDPKLNSVKIEPPPAKEVPPPQPDMRQRIIEMIIMMVVGGVVNGVMGAAFGGMFGK